MKITYLGSGNAFVPQRDWGSVLVNDTILLDAGPSVLVNLNHLSLDTTRIRHIFISHFHGDHFFGLPFLLLQYQFMTPTPEPLAIIGPRGVEARMRQLMELAYPDLVDLGTPRPLHFVEVQPAVEMLVDGLRFRAIPVEHGGPLIDAYGFRLYLEDGVLAYSGDTCMTNALFDLIDGAQVIILEADSPEISTVHLGREALRTLLARVPGESQVFLNHLDTPSAEPWRDLNVTVPEDLQTFHLSFPHIIEVSHD